MWRSSSAHPTPIRRLVSTLPREATVTSRERRGTFRFSSACSLTSYFRSARLNGDSAALDILALRPAHWRIHDEDHHPCRDGDALPRGPDYDGDVPIANRRYGL